MKKIIFDLGNVLINFDFTEFWEKIGAKPAQKRFLEKAEKPILLFEAGKISKEAFFPNSRRFMISKCLFLNWKRFGARCFLKMRK